MNNYPLATNTWDDKELQAIQSVIDKDIYKIAITNKPCDFSDVRRISDDNKTLPPKSTYIEPKLRSGMIIQEF